MNSFDRIIDVIKIIHGSSLSAGNIFKKDTTSHNTEYIERLTILILTKSDKQSTLKVMKI